MSDIKGDCKPFANKQEYLEWRAEWRANYRDLSARIREAKIDNKKLNRAGKSTICLVPYKNDATQMIANRRLSKERAEEQYQASLEEADLNQACANAQERVEIIKAKHEKVAA